MKKLATWISKTSQQFRSKLSLGGRSQDQPPIQPYQVSSAQSAVPAVRVWNVVKAFFNNWIQVLLRLFGKLKPNKRQDENVDIKLGFIQKFNQKYLKLPPPFARFLTPFIITVSLVAAYAVLGFYLLPAVLKAKLPSIIQEQTGRKSSIANIEFNPFQLIANIQGFKILEKNGKPFAEFEKFNLDVNGIESIKKRSLVIDDITLTKPTVHLAKNKDGKFNFEDMVKSKKKEKPKKKDDGNLFPFNVTKLAIKEGKLFWDDKHFAKAVSEEIAPINLSVSGLSTEAKSKAKLAVDLALKSGGKLEWKASVGVNPVFSEGVFKLDKVQLHKVLALALSDAAAFDLQGHELFNLDYKLGYEKKDLKVTINKSRLELQNFQFSDKSTHKIVLKTPNFAVESDAIVTVADNHLDVIIKKGKLNGHGLQYSQETPEPISAEIPEFSHELDIKLTQSKDSLNIITNKSQLAIKKFKFSGLKDPMTVSVPELNHETDVKVSKAKDSLKISVDTTKIAINNVQFLGPNAAKIQAKIPKLNLETTFELGLADKKNTEVNFTKGKFYLQGLEMTEKGEQKTLVKIPVFGLNGIGFNLKNQEVVVASVTGKNAEFQAWLNKDATINYQSLFSAPKIKAAERTNSTIATARTVDFTEDTSEASANPPVEPAKTKKDWLIKVNNLALENFSLDFEDKTLKKPVVMVAKPINIKLNNFNSKLDTKLPFQLDIGVNKTGSIKLKGNTVILPLVAQVDVDITNIDLDTFQPYVDKFAKVDVIDGKFNAKGLLEIKKPSNKPIDIKFKGNTNVADLVTRDQILSKDLVKWDNLTLNDVNVDVLANRYTASTLLIEKPYARVTIRKDKTINFSDLVIDNKAASPKPTKSASTVPSKKDNSKKPDFRLDKIKIVDGSSDFADLSLILPFAAQIKSLDGGAVGISSEQKSTIKVDLKGNAYDLAPVDIKGEVSPYLGNYDVELNFDGMPMPLVTPYMVQFAGYKIEKGKLTLGLKYQVENRKLKASNSILIDQLELGEKVENPNAVSLPLELAITLLKDSDGKIKLDVPLTGSLEDPQFSIGHIITDALVNVLTKIISAPFSALASLVGGSDEDLSNVAFKAGANSLDAKEKTKLDNIAKALKEKNTLNIEIKGAAYEEQDWPALQDDALFDQLKQRKAAQLSKEEGKKVRAEYVELSDDDYKKMLTDAFIEKFPSMAEKSIFGTPKLINSDAGDFYQVARQKMETSIKPDPERLRHLANDRSQAIAKYLVQKAGIANERVFILDSALDPKRNGKEVVSLLSLKSN